MADQDPLPPLWYRIWYNSTYPIVVVMERLQAWLGHRLGIWVEFLEWVFGYIAAMVSLVLFAPFRWMMRSRLVEATQIAQHKVAEKTADTSVRFRDSLADVMPRIFPPKLFWPFYWLFDQSLLLLDFMRAWFATRDFRNLLWALPAIVLGATLGATLVLGAKYSTQAKIRHYEQARWAALEAKNQEQADFLLARLLQLGFEKQDRADFESAMALIEEDKTDEALEIMRKLAPTDRPKFAPAHIYLAAALIDGQVVTENPWPLIRRHAEFALQLDPTHPLGKRFLIEAQLQDEEYDAAVEGMEEMRRVFPDFNAELAHQYASRGENVKAKKYARAAIDYFTTLQEQMENSTDKEAAKPLAITAQGYLRMAEAHALVGEPERELELLREGFELHPTSNGNRAAYAKRLEREIIDFEFSNAGQTEYLKQLLIANPAQEQALKLLFTAIRERVPEATLLADSISNDPNAPAKLIKAVGDMFLSTDQLDKAKVTYQMACEKDVQSAYAWNNLAWIWSNHEPIDMEMALQCTERALQAKQDPNFYETRGQILVKLERWEEAASFLERALNGTIPDPQAAHRSLASIYSALGKTEQAAAHRAASSQ